MRKTTWVLGWLTVSSILLSSGLAQSSKERERPLLLGGPVPAHDPEIKLDPRLPEGALRGPGSRPEALDPPACSFRYPLCVRLTHGVSPERGLVALGALERAYRRLVLTLGLPAPSSSSNLDLYLTEEGPLIQSDLDTLSSRLFDSGASFCTSSAQSPELLERAATQCLGEAIGRYFDAGTTPHVLRAFATRLWWATGRPTSLDVEAIDDVQLHPEAPIVTRDRDATSEGAALWFEQLERRRGPGDPHRQVR